MSIIPASGLCIRRVRVCIYLYIWCRWPAWYAPSFFIFLELIRNNDVIAFCQFWHNWYTGSVYIYNITLVNFKHISALVSWQPSPKFSRNYCLLTPLLMNQWRAWYRQILSHKGPSSNRPYCTNESISYLKCYLCCHMQFYIYRLVASWSVSLCCGIEITCPWYLSGILLMIIAISKIRTIKRKAVKIEYIQLNFWLTKCLAKHQDKS